jgi:Dolichyl-phosphate-mannose-protein mannosyltransferase
LTRSLAIFAVVNLALLAATGVHVGGDTGLFLDGARRLMQGQPLIDREPSYLGYIAVVGSIQAVGAGSIGVVLFQIVAATAGAGAVYRLAMELGGARAAMLATGLLTLDVDVNRWHTYVLADSLYISAFAISVWLVHRTSEGPTNWWRYAATTVVLVALGLIRPEGWFVLPAAGFYWVARGFDGAWQRLSASLVVVAACVVAAFAVAPRLSGNVSAVDPGEMLRRGQTIWDYDSWRIAMPGSNPPQPDQVEAPVSYAMHHPAATAKLMLARIGVHLAHVRPFYSRTHNLVILLWLLPIYALTALAVWMKSADPLMRWIVVACGTQALVVALTHADWDGRYLAHVMPVVYPLAACGFWSLFRRPVFVRAS